MANPCLQLCIDSLFKNCVLLYKDLDLSQLKDVQTRSNILNKSENATLAFCQNGQKVCVVFLAPLAEGQRAIVMALCPSSVRASVNFFFKKLLLRNY